MKYLRIKWLHNNLDEPVELYLELNENHFDTRRVEVFPDGSMGAASNTIGVGETRLSYLPILSLEEFNSSKEFQAQETTAAEFEDMWQRVLDRT